MVAGGGTMASAPPPAIGGNGGCTGVSAKISNFPGTTTGAAMAASPQGTNEGGPTRTRTSENRRSNKPIMEKKRRARINNCLNELKTLILDAMKKDPARHSKLEKADILEMTVKHLEALQRQQMAMAAATDPNVANKFRAGFTECAGEVGRFPGLEGPVKRRLLQHLANCLNSTSPPNGVPASAGATVATAAAVAGVDANQTSTTPPTNQGTNSSPPLQVHILRTPSQTDAPSANSSNIILANTNGQGVQLVPTRLPNGDIALILPSSNSFRSTRTTAPVTPSSSPSPSVSSTSSGSSPLPMLIPLPQRTNANSPSIAIDRLSMQSSTPPRQITIVTTQNPQRLLIPQQQGVGNKNASLLGYECGEEHVVQQGVLIPDDRYHKSDKVIPVMREVDPPFMQAPRKDVYEDRMSPTDDRLYDRDRIIMTRDGRIIERDHSGTVYGSHEKDSFRSNRETLIHIPERDSYYEGISPRSPVGYADMDHQKYGEYYPDHYEERPYSPDMPKPLALVTRKKCEEYGNEERPWRPW